MASRTLKLGRGGQSRIILILLAVNALIMTALSFLSRTFLTYGNLTAVMNRMSELSMLAIAQTVVFISGGFDLTVGATMALSGAVCGTLYVAGVPFPIALAAALGAGVAVGALNAFLVVAFKLQPFIVTLATMSIVRSIVYALLKGNVLTQFPESFLNLGYVYVLKVPLIFLIVVATAVLIGGTAITGGKGSVPGSLLGILAMYLLLNGFNLLGLNPFWNVIILGVILIYVVGQEAISGSLREFLTRRRPQASKAA